MGGHYGSVQVRPGDRNAVKAVAEHVANAMKVRLFIGPAIDGWVGLYPENNGQDEKVGHEVARLIDGYVLHLLVHDDDIFAYWLYHDRQLIDSHWSAPGYFGEQNRASEERMIGNPEVFRPLIQDRVSRLSNLLGRGDAKPAFESERLGEFAKLLQIANAVQAYEYLKEQDHGRVKGWRGDIKGSLTFLSRRHKGVTYVFVTYVFVICSFLSCSFCLSIFKFPSAPWR